METRVVTPRVLLASDLEPGTVFRPVGSYKELFMVVLIGNATRAYVRLTSGLSVTVAPELPVERVRGAFVEEGA